jgi:hypothetical protein
VTSPDELREQLRLAIVDARYNYDHNGNLVIHEMDASAAALAVVTPELERRDEQLREERRRYVALGGERDEKQFEVERLRRWVDRFREGMRTVTEERDALRAQITKALREANGAYGYLPIPEYGTNEDMTRMLSRIRDALTPAPVSELVPATPKACVCNGGWTVDENYQPEDYERDEPLRPENGLIPCGFCDHGGWDAPWPAADTAPPAAASADTTPQRPPFPYEARQWMEDGARVECFSGKNPDDVVHEGWIIGMTEAPTVRVQKDDGQIISWVLGITRRKPECVPSPSQKGGTDG